MLDDDCEQANSMLNDVAVSLLQQNCYLQAFETFKDAMEEDPSAVEAAERLLAPEPFPKPPPIKYTTVTLKDLSTTGDTVDKIFRHFSHDDDTTAAVLNVRLLGEELVSPELVDAVIEYNFAMAHQAYAIALLKKRKRIAFDNHSHNSAFMLKTAEKTLDNILFVIQKDGSSRNYVCQALSLRLVVLLSLHKQVVGTDEELCVRKKLREVYKQISTLVEFFDTAKSTIKRLQIYAKKTMKASLDASLH